MKGKHNAYENTLDAALILKTTNEIGASKSHKPILFSFYLDIIRGKFSINALLHIDMIVKG